MAKQLMFFSVLSHGIRPPAGARSKAYLLTENWDDWFKFSTLYSLVFYDADGERHSIGDVKIGQFGMAENQRRPSLPNRFDALDDRFFSLGQDDSYYDDLNKLGADVRDRILRGLRDVALDAELFERALEEKVTGTSLLRFSFDSRWPVSPHGVGWRQALPVLIQLHGPTSCTAEGRAPRTPLCCGTGSVTSNEYSRYNRA